MDCPTDPPLAADTLLRSSVVRAALRALLDSWADSAASKRRERQVFFYRDSADHSPVPQIQVFWAVDSLPPTPCQSSVKGPPGGLDLVLMGFGHSHPFAQGEMQPVEYGPRHAGFP